MPVGEILTRVRANGKVTADDVLAARRAVYGNDGRIDPHEIEALFAVDEVATSAIPAWSMLIVEAGTDFIVHQEMPSGYISEANAEWLIARIGRDGMVKTATELELVVKVLEVAKSSPVPLVQFALRQVASAVVDGAGPLASGDDLHPGRVGRGEADLIRRILYAFGGDSGIAITRAEAEVLFDINDRTIEADNDPAWTDLFVKAIANCIMAASGYTVPPREVALRREEWLDSDSGGVANFFSRMASGGLHGIFDAYTMATGEDAQAIRNIKREAEIAGAEIVTEDEAEWLAHRIGRDGHLHENEKALLRFIHDESPKVHPALAPLIENAA